MTINYLIIQKKKCYSDLKKMWEIISVPNIEPNISPSLLCQFAMILSISVCLLWLKRWEIFCLSFLALVISPKQSHLCYSHPSNTAWETPCVYSSLSWLFGALSHLLQDRRVTCQWPVFLPTQAVTSFSSPAGLLSSCLWLCAEKVVNLCLLWEFSCSKNLQPPSL